MRSQHAATVRLPSIRRASAREVMAATLTTLPERDPASPVFRTVKGLPLRSLGGGGRATALAAPARAGGCRGGRGSAAGWG